MAAMKTMTCIVLDVGASMGQNIEDSLQLSKLDVSLAFVGSQMTQKMMSSKTAEFGLYTYGDSITNNYLNTAQGEGQYEHINEVFSISRSGPLALEAIRSVKASSLVGDIIDGIVVGQDSLMRTNAKYKFNRVMLLLTDGETEVTGVEDLEQIVTSMRLNNCPLYVGLMGKLTSSSSPVKQGNAELLKDIAEKTGGAYVEAATLADLYPLLSGAPGSTTRPRLTKIKLEISPNLVIPCVFWGKVSKAALPTLKKQPKSSSNSSGDLNNGGFGDGDEEGGGEGLDAEESGGTVKRDTSYRNPTEEDEEVSFEDRVKGYKYGSQFVPMSKAVEDALQVEGPQIIQLMKFVPSSSIRRHELLEAASVLQGSSAAESAHAAIVALSAALHRRNAIALARLVKKENCDPQFVALSPPSSVNNGSLLMHRLPCCEDIREYAFPSFDLDKLSRSQKSAVSSFVDAMTEKSSDSSNASTPYPVQKLCPFNPAKQSLLTILQQKLSGVTDPLVLAKTPTLQLTRISDALPSLLDSFDNSDEGRRLALESSLKKVLGEFPLVPSTSDAAGKRKVYWSDIAISKAAKVSVDEDMIGAAVMGLTGAPSSSSASSSASTSASTAAYEGTTSEASAAERKKRAEDAMAEKLKEIERLVTVGATNAQYRKALAQLKELRSAAIEGRLHDSFNDLLRTNIKVVFRTGRHKAFWAMIVADSVTLIDHTEDATSTVSPQEAAAFLGEDVAEVVAAPVPVAAPAEEEDLFGNMM